MTVDDAIGQDVVLRSMLLREEITQFLFREAELLDRREFTEWLSMLDPAISYRMPLRLNVRFGDEASNETVPGEEVCWLDDTFDTLEARVLQILTGVHWAEEPASRATRLISNVMVAPIGDEKVEARSAFLFYRNRVDSETDILVGRRNDVLSKTSGSWRILERVIRLDQNVLTAKNLTLPF